MKKLFLALFLAMMLAGNALAAVLSNSFTATGAGPSLSVKVGDSFDYAVSGTFVGTVKLQRSTNGFTWSTTATITGSSSGTVIANSDNANQVQYRFFCEAYTSGTIVTTLTEDTGYSVPIQEFKNKNGKVIAYTTETGLVVQDLTATGTVTGVSGSGSAPGGSAAELQFRSDATTLGAVSGSAVDSSGNVGIGTTTLNEKVNVGGNITATGNVISKNITSFNGGTPVYEGLIATRGEIPQTINTGATQMMSRSVHYSRDAITRLKIAIPNWWVNSATPFQELGTGTTATVTASIEYPAGTFTGVTFAGSATGTIPDLTTLWSDYIPVTIPTNTKFYVRIYVLNAGGVVFETVNPTSTGGSGVEAGTSGITDKTLSGTVSSSSTHLSPLAIVGYTNRPSFAIMGDSRTQGTGDTTHNSAEDYGEIAPSIGPTYAYTNLARGSDKAAAFNIIAQSPLRRDILKYASHIFNGYGFNDIWANGDAAETVVQTMKTISDLVHGMGKKVYIITIGPKAGSSDSWATTINQTIGTGSPAGGDTRRKAYNALVRAGGLGADGYVEIADQIESARDSGYWAVDGTANKFTSDGVHESSYAYQLIKTNAAISPTIADGITYVNGNVGIGTATPSTALHVVGGERVTGLVSCNTIDTDANGVMSCGTDATGSATPAGSDTYVQFNDSSAFGGDSKLIFNKTTGQVTVGGSGVSTFSSGINIPAGQEIQSAGNRVNYNLSVYASGTVYSLTNSDAAVDFGTTDPTVTLDKAGTYLLIGRAYLKYNAATYAGTQTATLHLRRTNNTAADISNATTTATMRIITTITDSVGVMQIPAVLYTTSNTNDAIAVYGSVSAAPAAGSVDVAEASIVAIRLY